MSAVSRIRKPVRQRGDVIRGLRVASGRRTGEFAKACGLKLGSLTNIEGEDQQASWEALHRIARELAVPVRTLLRNPDEVPLLTAADRQGAA
jgi:transcriptional regulator with XRE-family HTH domain